MLSCCDKGVLELVRGGGQSRRSDFVSLREILVTKKFVLFAFDCSIDANRIRITACGEVGILSYFFYILSSHIYEHEWHYRCSGTDSIVVYGKMEERLEKIMTLCGRDTASPIMSSGPILVFEFLGIYSSTYSTGFKAFYNFVEGSGHLHFWFGCDICGHSNHFRPKHRGSREIFRRKLYLV